MIPGQFDYVRPGNLDETLRILKDREGEAKLLSGGYSLIPLIKLRLAQPALLVDLRDVTGLDRIVETDDYLSIGARATHRQIHEARRRPRPLPAAPRRDRDDRRPAGPQLGHDRWLRRARRPGLGLAGGPHRGQRDDRLPQPDRRAATIAARDFFLDTFQTAIEPTEVLTEIRVVRRPRRPPAPTRSSSARSATSRRSVSPRSSGWTRRVTSRAPGSASPGSPTRRSPRPTPRPSWSATPRRMTCSARRVPRPERRASPVGDVRGTGRIQAGDGRGADPQGPPPRHRTRPRVRVGGPHDEHPAHLGHRQRRGPRGRCRAPPPARPLPARQPRADRHARRLRHEQLRRLHHPRRRRERQVVHDARRPGRRPRDQDHRGDGRRRRPSTRSSRRSGTSTASSAASAPRA